MQTTLSNLKTKDDFKKEFRETQYDKTTRPN